MLVLSVLRRAKMSMDQVCLLCRAGQSGRCSGVGLSLSRPLAGISSIKIGIRQGRDALSEGVAQNPVQLVVSRGKRQAKSTRLLGLTNNNSLLLNEMNEILRVLLVVLVRDIDAWTENIVSGAITQVDRAVSTSAGL